MKKSLIGSILQELGQVIACICNKKKIGIHLLLWCLYLFYVLTPVNYDGLPRSLKVLPINKRVKDERGIGSFMKKYPYVYYVIHEIKVFCSLPKSLISYVL